MAEIFCAGHALKEVLSAEDCLVALQRGVRAAGDNTAGLFIISDGGDGFLEACQRFAKGELREVEAIAPLGEPIITPYLYDEQNRTAYIETALCSGLRIVDPARRNIMLSGTAGVGDMVAAARKAGARKIFAGLGGSATCDGGIGFLWRLADHAGQCQPGVCEPRVAMDMPELPAPEIAQIREWLEGVELVALVDVGNPLRGQSGAAKVFAPQKGATPEETEQLDAWMGEWCDRVQRNAGVSACDLPGSGAAGGLGFAFGVLGGEIRNGAHAVCEMSGLADALRPSTTMLTAEGKFDMTSLGGKAPWTAALKALERGSKAVIFCGVADPSAAKAAHERGVAVVEFGRDLPAEDRAKLSAELLTDAVEKHLAGRSEVGV